MLYLEEVPERYFDSEFMKFPRMSWGFTYGEDDGIGDVWEALQAHQQAHRNTFLHPFFRYKDPSGVSPVGDNLHIGEDFATRWRSAVQHLAPIHEYVSRTIQRA